MSDRWSIIVHGGAKTVRPERQAANRAGCLAAVRAGQAVLAGGGSAIDAVVIAIRVLEDDPAFNAGYGSVLNSDGEVELDAALMDGLEEWLAPFLDGVSRRAHLERIDLSSALRALLPWDLKTRLDAEAPTHVEVPSGSRIPIDYDGEEPVLAVRLQEMFGLAETPRIAGGRLAVKLHLLSPAQRPVQVTQDLANFWRSTYAEVKKDLKGRYPKHYWPDDPLIAEPTARAKPRK